MTRIVISEVNLKTILELIYLEKNVIVHLIRTLIILNYWADLEVAIFLNNNAYKAMSLEYYLKKMVSLKYRKRQKW